MSKAPAGPVDWSTGHGVVKPRPDGRKTRCPGPPFCPTCRREELDIAAEWTTTAAAWQVERDALYSERAQLAAHLAAVYPSTLGYTDPTEPEWAVLTVVGPFGPMSWHIGPGDIDHFHHVRRDSSVMWDGHTTPEKYKRLAWATAHAASERAA